MWLWLWPLPIITMDTMDNKARAGKVNPDRDVLDRDNKVKKDTGQC